MFCLAGSKFDIFFQSSWPQFQRRFENSKPLNDTWSSLKFAATQVQQHASSNRITRQLRANLHLRLRTSRYSTMHCRLGNVAINVIALLTNDDRYRKFWTGLPPVGVSGQFNSSRSPSLSGSSSSSASISLVSGGGVDVREIDGEGGSDVCTFCHMSCNKQHSVLQLGLFQFWFNLPIFRRHHEGALNLQDQKMTNQNFSIAGKCRTWKMMDRITGLENDGPRERCTPMYSALNTTGSSTAGIYLSPAKCNN